MGRITEAVTLQTRGIMVQNPRCQQCNNSVESVDHVLIHCNYAKEVRFWILKWCGVQQDIQANTVKEIIDYATSYSNRSSTARCGIYG